jgi:transposase-like protein
MRFGEGVENVSLLIAIGISDKGYREVLDAMEGYRENKESWLEFLRLLVCRGLSGVKLMIADAHLGIKGSVKECFPDAMYRRCKIHFIRNILSKVPRRESKTVSLMIKAIFAQESKD